METLNKREERIISWIVSGSTRKRTLLALILLFVLAVYGSFYFFSKTNISIKSFDERISKIEYAVSNFKTTTINESKLKQNLILQLRVINEIGSTSLYIITWLITAMFWIVFFSIYLFISSNNMKDKIIKKLSGLESIPTKEEGRIKG